ncbi:MAG: acetyl-CoA acetyltransferase [Arenicella sp.]|jgi:acetyl-CoA acetyltransferase
MHSRQKLKTRRSNTLMNKEIAIIGIGIHPFGRTENLTGLQQGTYAVNAALSDAKLRWQDVDFAVGGSQDAGYADTMVSDLGLTGIPFTNVFNGCATGGTALSTAMRTIASGDGKLGVVTGFDKHPRGAFKVDPAEWGLGEWYGQAGFALTTQFFAMKIKRYMYDYGITEQSLVKVAHKAFINAEQNANAWRRTPMPEDVIAESAMINDPLRKFMFCSPAEGGVALVVCAADEAHKYSHKPIIIKACVMRTRRYGTFECFSAGKAITDSPTPAHFASKAAFELTGITPDQVDIAQLQDTESGAEIMHMAETGLCQHGEQETMLANGETLINGRLPINTDGGCIANGEPVGASGLRQIHEICLQLRGEAGPRQVQKTLKTGFTQVYGAPGIAGVTILQTE